jgi:hypothetical protein
MAAASDRKVQIVAADPVDDDGDGMFGLADRAQRRVQSRANVGGRKIIGVMRVRRLEEEHVAGGKVRQRRQWRRLCCRHRRRVGDQFDRGGWRRLGGREFFDTKRMFHGSLPQ